MFLDGPLEMVDQRTLHKTADNAEPITADSVFQQRAVSLLQLRAIVPAVIEGASLAQYAPVTVEHLRPGSLRLLDVHDACYGPTARRQPTEVGDRLGVSRSRPGRAGVGVLNPPGYTEADLG